MAETNGMNGLNDLNATAQAAVQHGLTQWQAMMQDRDSLKQEADRLRQEVAGYKVALEAQSSRIAQMESLMADAVSMRDQAMAERVKWEALFVSIQAQLKAFEVPAGPLVRGIEHDHDDWQKIKAIKRQHERELDLAQSAGQPPIGG